MIQELINKAVNWFHGDQIAKFDQDHAELIKGRQFPKGDAISKQLDFALNNIDNNQISKDFLSYYKDDVDIAGVDNSSD